MSFSSGQRACGRFVCHIVLRQHAMQSQACEHAQSCVCSSWRSLLSPRKKPTEYICVGTSVYFLRDFPIGVDLGSGGFLAATISS